MRDALQQAEAALEAEEIPVGCVFVSEDGNVISRGVNKTNESRNGTQHAEMTAIERAILVGKSPEVFVGSTLYVTCEPCIMCAAAVAKVGVKRVVFGCHNDRFGGNGSILSVHSPPLSDGRAYRVVSGVLQAEAVAVFQRFYTSENRRGERSCNPCLLPFLLIPIFLTYKSTTN